MSNHLAIATVTAVLQRTLQASVQRHVESVRISTVAPHRIGQGTPETGINLFLYQVTRNNALKNSDGITQRSRHQRTPWRQTALELHYLLSFYGNEAELEPQQLLGSVVRTFNDRTTLPSPIIQDTLNDSSFTFLAPSDLTSQVQELQILPEDLSLEDLSKIWSVFFQTPYALSIAYKVMAVVIDGEDPAERALPVRDRPIQSMVPFPTRPQIERVTAQGGGLQPILPDGCLHLQGQHLQGPQTHIRLGNRDVVPQEISANQLILPLSTVPPEALRAGVQSIQVVHRGDRAATNATSVISNPMPFTLCPVLQSIEVSDLEIWDEDHSSATLTVAVSPPIGATQAVLLSLYEWSTQQPATYLIEVEPRVEDSDRLTIAIAAVKPGDYLVRLIVDGAESPLGIDDNPNSPTFQWYDRPRLRLIQP
jgi:hypothetical protein